MTKRRKLRNSRPKAFFGIGETAAIVAQTLAQVGALGAQTVATVTGAKQGADAQLAAAKQQADALEAQNRNNNRLQTEMMQFTRDQNEANRKIMADLQMNQQLTAGGLNTRDRKEASKTIVKYGGRKKRKLRDVPYSLQGGNSFRVTDGGSALPLGLDDDGAPVGFFVGDKHYQTHEGPDGKPAGGVGAQLLDNLGRPVKNGEFEAEGGEPYKERPFSISVLSAHTRHGFNPAKAFMNGMPFDEAEQIQEYYKAIDGIDSEGNKITPVKRNRAALGAILPNTINPYENTRIIPGATTLAVEQNQLNNFRNALKQGGSVKRQINSLRNRRKFPGGGDWWLSPTISGAGNLLGGALSALGIGLGSSYMSKRTQEAGDILANAYGNLKGVDFESVFGDSGSAAFSRGLYMPAVRSSYYHADPWLEEVHRNTRRAQRATKNSTNSSSAQLNRMATINANEGVETGKIYGTKQNWEEQVKQQNMNAINEAGQANAQLMMQYLKDYTAQKADLAKFNANIENEKILGAAETRANTLQQLGQIGANKRQGIAGSLGNALQSIGNGFANALYNENIRKDNLTMAKLSATDSGLVNYYGDRNVPIGEAQSYFDSLMDAANTATTPEKRDTYLGLARRLASMRGIPWDYAYGTLNTNRPRFKPSIVNIQTPTLTFDWNNLPTLK